jgi:hypothetical protein
MADDWFQREAREQRVLLRVRERLVQDKAVRERTSLPHFGGLTAEREERYTRLVEAEDAAVAAPSSGGRPSRRS